MCQFDKCQYILIQFETYFMCGPQRQGLLAGQSPANGNLVNPGIF